MAISKHEIEKMEMLLIEGIRSSDLSFIDTTIHDRLLCVGPDGTTITKAMDMAAHKSGQMIVEKLIPTIENIEIIGDTGVSIVVYDTKGKMLGNSIEGKFKYLRVWKKYDDGLKVIAASCFKLP